MESDSNVWEELIDTMLTLEASYQVCIKGTFVRRFDALGPTLFVEQPELEQQLSFLDDFVRNVIDRIDKLIQQSR